MKQKKTRPHKKKQKKKERKKQMKRTFVTSRITNMLYICQYTENIYPHYTDHSITFQKIYDIV